MGPDHDEEPTRGSDDTAYSFSYTSPIRSTPPPLPSPSQIPGTVPSRQSVETPQSQLNECEAKEKPLIEIVQEKYERFDSQALIVDPFEEQSRKDAEFESELSAMLLEVMLETHAWASTRPRKEQQAAGQQLELMVASVMNVESEQDRTRARLNEFVTRIKTALAALTGI